MTDPLHLRTDDKKWTQVGTSSHPLRLRQENGTWVRFTNGTGAPLKIFKKDGTWEIATRAGRMPQPFGYAFSDDHLGHAEFRLTPGWSATTERSIIEGDADWSFNTNNGVAYINGAVQSVSSMYETASDGRAVQYTKDTTHWVVLPIRDMIEGATAILRYNIRMAPDAQVDLDHVDIDFQCYGWSIEKSVGYFSPIFYHPSGGVIRGGGQGRIAFDGIMYNTLQETELFPFAHPTYKRWPVVRNQSVARNTSGETVWQGDLNGLAKRAGYHGLTTNPFGDDPSILTHHLHAKYWGATGIQYRLYTSEVAEPHDFDIGNPYTSENYFQFATVVNCYFRIN